MFVLEIPKKHETKRPAWSGLAGSPQSGANAVASTVSSHGASGCGPRQRSAPTGGCAKGTPRKASTVWAGTPIVLDGGFAGTMKPSTGPDGVVTTRASACGARSCRTAVAKRPACRRRIAAALLPVSAQALDSGKHPWGFTLGGFKHTYLTGVNCRIYVRT